MRGDGPWLWQVRVDAVAALRNLVDAFHADDLPSIKPLIPSLLNQLFALMAEVGCEREPRAHQRPAAALDRGVLCRYGMACVADACVRRDDAHRLTMACLCSTVPGLALIHVRHHLECTGPGLLLHQSCMSARSRVAPEFHDGATSARRRMWQPRVNSRRGRASWRPGNGSCGGMRACAAPGAQVESEDVVFTLETIVEKFGEEMAPFAVGLCQHLTQAFWRLQARAACSTPLLPVGHATGGFPVTLHTQLWCLDPPPLRLCCAGASRGVCLVRSVLRPRCMHQGRCASRGRSFLNRLDYMAPAWRACPQAAAEEEDDEEGGEGLMAAYGCMRALSTVLDSVSSMPALFPQLEAILFPVMQVWRPAAAAPMRSGSCCFYSAA